MPVRAASSRCGRLRIFWAFHVGKVGQDHISMLGDLQVPLKAVVRICFGFDDWSF